MSAKAHNADASDMARVKMRTDSRTSRANAIFYPVTLVATLTFIFAEVYGLLGPLGKAYPLYLLVLISGMVALERIRPMRAAWGMTKRSFFHRDLPMLALNGATIAATTYAVTWLAQHHGGLPVHQSTLPWQAQALCALLLSDFLWYWVHRYSHEGQGQLARWLWKIHAVHHRPGEVYVLMHAVAHPINSAYVRVILMAPAIVFGFSPEAVFAASVFNGFQGLVSHFNVDARAGRLNHLFIGTELHRAHHSVNLDEAKNYAATFSIWDQLFGTLRLPANGPMALGIAGPAHNPSPILPQQPMQAKPYASQVPVNSAISTYLPAAYFYDATSISVNDTGLMALDYFLKALRETPAWVDLLMAARNHVVSMLGLKNLGKLSGLDPGKAGSAYVVGDRVGIFTLIMNSPCEVLLGDQDRHLDVTLSVHTSRDTCSAQVTVTVTTVVHVHNWYGRLYMLPVTPMHRIIGPAVLKAIGKPSLNN
jgi:sterol desaturase/sphingolipid hydroxylase (fatty acid hydroxylase superfamily)